MKNFLKTFVFLLTFFAWSQDPIREVITSTGSSTFTVPIGVSSITVECWGAGGRGGTRSSNGAAGGGGGGAYSRSVHNVTPGSIINYNVGAGSTSTSPGGDTWFINSTSQIAKGGGSCGNNVTSGAAGGSASLSIGDIVFAGGNGSNRISSDGGGGGSSAGIASIGTSAINSTSGAIAPNGGGNGGNGRTGSSGAGSPGSFPGGGGGGARRSSGTQIGGAGGNGQIVITYIIETNYTIYYQNFDENDGGWTSSSAGGKVGSWVRETAPLVGQGFYFRTNNYANFTRNTGIFLTSPVINLSGYKDIHFSIDIRHELPDSGDGMQVQYSINGGAWTVLNGSNTTYWYNNNSIGGLGSTAGWTGTNTENANSPSKFNEATCALAALNNQSNVRFRVYFADDNDTSLGGGVAIDNVVIRGNPITPFADPTDGPANVSTDLKLWLKSDAVSGFSDGQALTQWSDLAFDNHARSWGTRHPLYRNSASNNLNYNPIITFNKTNGTYLTGKGGYWTQDVYIALQTNTIYDKSGNNSHYLVSGKYTKDAPGQDGTGFMLGRGSSRFNSDQLVSHLLSTYNNAGTPAENSYGRSYSDPSISSIEPGVIILNIKSNTNVTPPVTEIYYNGKRIDNHTATAGIGGTGPNLNHSDFRNLTYNLGAGQLTINGFNPPDFHLDGGITEVLSYSVPKSSLDQHKIFSYLALKNGISLKSPSSSLSFTSNQADWNYVDSNNTVIWDVAANAGFNFDVAGIGRDDNGSLVQKQSKSSNNNTVVTIGIGDVLPVNSQNTNNFTGDRQFLVWGSNDQNMNNSGAPLNINLGPMTVTTVTDIVNRKWKIVETGGDVGVAKVSVPVSAFTSGLPALGPTDAYVMVVANDPNFTSSVETVFMQTEGTNQTCRYDFDGVRYFTFGVAHRIVASNHLTFDGNDDFVRIDKVNALNSQFNIMAWVNLNGANDAGSNRMIVSKANSTNGYEFFITTDNRVRMQWINGATTHGVTSSVALPNNIWHHVSANYNGSTLTLYIDGVAAGSANIASAPVNIDSFFSIGSKYIDKDNILNLYKGNIEELRIFNKALSVNEIRFIMNQEIEQNGSNIRGKVIPSTITKNDILELSWNHLQAHYTMNSYIGTHLDDDSQFTNRGSLIIPDKVSINPQTAPLPYITTANGSWDSASTWSNGNQMYVPFGLSIVDNSPIAWNIIRVGHNITTTGNKEVLSLFLDNGTYTVQNDSKIQISHYLLLNGKIDLVGRSQLVQDANSDLAVTSVGSIERDQQGQRNRFNYNYWSSPVSTINSTTINHGFRVSQVMRDGTNPNNPLPFNWTNGVNGSSTTPITLSSYWIFKFVNTSNNIANWVQVGHNGLLNTGEGFTMKGHGNINSGLQNYVFVGKPNNGVISRPVSANNLLLTGNPYPSAIDAEKFIDDNVNTITGALYFWEHYATNNTHNLGGYQGGYATLTKVGATPPIAPAMISGMGSSDKIAGRYIPVGQGFFVVGSTTGGNIVFNNDQRLFIKEDHALSNTMFKSAIDKQTTSAIIHETNNSNDPVAPKLRRPKIRIGMNSFNGHHRQILIGFMGNEADDSYNPGYDGYHIDNQQSEMYFILPNGTSKLNVQGVGAFQLNAVYPIGFKAGGNGTYQFTLDGTEDFPENIPIYIYDNVTNIYHNIKDGIANITLTSGEYLNRFDLRFQNQTLSNPDFDFLSTVKLFYTQNNHVLNLVNPMSLEFDSLKVFNILGQEVQVNKIQDTSNHLEIPVKNLPSGTYLVKVKGAQGELQTKFIIP